MACVDDEGGSCGEPVRPYRDFGGRSHDKNLQVSLNSAQHKGLGINESKLE